MRIRIPNNWKPRDYQMPAWKYLADGGRHAELVWPRRHGKDDIALNWTAVAAFKRVANYWHMLPEAAQARKAIWDAVNPHTGKRRIDEAFPLEIRKTTRNQEMQIEFINGSSWQVVGSDNFNSLVGSTPAGIVYSEWALANPSSRAYLRPILAENNGWQIFITTPRGRNHALSTYNAARKEPTAFAQLLTAEQAGVFTKEQLDYELRAYIDDLGIDAGTAKFEQEYMCSFDAANLGAILAPSLRQLEQKGRISDNVGYDPDGDKIFISADLGRNDTATWYFWQPKVGGYSIIDHDSGFGIDGYDWADRIADKLNKYGNNCLGKIWLPHDAKAKTFAARHSAQEIFAKKFGPAHLGIVPRTSIADRISAARKVIQRCEFNETKCAIGLDALRSWSYRYDDVKKMFSSEPDHNWASHDGDGFSYGCQIINQYNPVRDMPQETKFWEHQTLNDLWQDSNHKSKRI